MRYRLLLVLAAVIWGFAFTAQRSAMAGIGPFTFTGVRFLLGAGVLAGVYWSELRTWQRGDFSRVAILGGLLFSAVVLQQIGTVYTTASNAGFITGLNIVFVPLVLRLIWRTPLPVPALLGVLLAATGLYFLSVGPAWAVNPGDLFVLGAALFFALHIIAAERLLAGRRPVILALGQFTVCGLLASGVALFAEAPTAAGLIGVWPQILYGGILSVGVGYTLQLVGQQHVPAVPASLIMTLECIFGAVGGALFLGEVLTPRQLGGCAVLLAGVVVAQLPGLSPGGAPVLRSRR